jgi:flagellar motor switch protein FliN/FliY
MTEPDEVVPGTPDADVPMQDAESFVESSQTASQAGGASVGAPAVHAEGELGLGLLEDIELDATLQFGSRDMFLREVLELGPGDVIELDRHVSEPVDLVVGDRIVARGEVVVANGNFALRITQVAAPQLRLESIRCLF